MSSALKDARWELAYRVIIPLGFTGMDQIPYQASARLLDGCQAILEGLSELEITDLARQWNERPSWLST